MARKNSDLEKSRDAASRDSLLDGDRQRLAESIDEASLLVWYASKKGLSDIDLKTIEAITDAKAKFRSNTLEPKGESLFWDSYRAFAKTIAPVTVESIRASYDLDSEAKNSAKKAIRGYSLSTLIILIILVILQAYWFIGTSMKTDIENTRANQKQIKLELDAAGLARIAVLDEYNKSRIEMNEAEKRRNAVGGMLNNENNIFNENFKKSLMVDIENIENRNELLQNKILEHEQKKDSLTESLEKGIDRIEGNFLILNAWDFYTERLLDITDDDVVENSFIEKEATEQGSSGQDEEATEESGVDENGEVTKASYTEEDRQDKSRAEWEQLLEEKKAAAEAKEGRVASDDAGENPVIAGVRPDTSMKFSEETLREMSLLTTSSILALFNQYFTTIIVWSAGFARLYFAHADPRDSGRYLHPKFERSVSTALAARCAGWRHDRLVLQSGNAEARRYDHTARARLSRGIQRGIAVRRPGPDHQRFHGIAGWREKLVGDVDMVGLVILPAISCRSAGERPADRR